MPALRSATAPRTDRRRMLDAFDTYGGSEQFSGSREAFGCCRGCGRADWTAPPGSRGSLTGGVAGWVMAWIEHHGTGYRVRLRHDGHLITDQRLRHPRVGTSKGRRPARRRPAGTAATRPRATPDPPLMGDNLAAGAHRLTRHTGQIPIHARHAHPADLRPAPPQRDHPQRRQSPRLPTGHHLAPASIRAIVTLLGLLLREAIDEHYLHFDPTARLRLLRAPVNRAPPPPRSRSTPSPPGCLTVTPAP
jgi:hypothetical protein